MKVIQHAFFITALLLGAVFFYAELNNDEFLRGPDAYYYALQADHWATTSEVKIPDSSHVHRVNGLLQRAGLSTESSIRLQAAASLFLLGVLTLLLAGQLGFLWQTFAVCWLLLSPSLVFVTIEFPKLFSFILLVPVWLYFLQKKPPSNLISVVPHGLAVFAHKAAIPIVGMSLTGVFLENSNMFFKNKRILFLFVVAFLFPAGLYFMLSDHFHILDFSRLGGLKNMSPGVVTLMTRQHLPIAIKMELLATFAVFMSAFIRYLKTTPRKKWPVVSCFALILPGVFPFSANEIFGIGERYAILLPYFFIVAAFFLLLSADKPVKSAKQAPIAFVLVIVALVVTVPYRLSYSHPQHLDPDNETYERITKNLKKFGIPMLIAHRGFNFYYKFKTGREAFHYEPEEHWDKMMIWRLTYRITPDEFDYYLTPFCGWDSEFLKNIGDKHYFLIREDCWNSFRNAITEEDDQDLYARVWNWWRNPFSRRPAFLYKKHQTDKPEEADLFPALPR